MQNGLRQNSAGACTEPTRSKVQQHEHSGSCLDRLDYLTQQNLEVCMLYAVKGFLIIVFMIQLLEVI